MLVNFLALAYHPVTKTNKKSSKCFSLPRQPERGSASWELIHKKPVTDVVFSLWTCDSGQICNLQRLCKFQKRKIIARGFEWQKSMHFWLCMCVSVQSRFLWQPISFHLNHIDTWKTTYANICSLNLYLYTYFLSLLTEKQTILKETTERDKKWVTLKISNWGNVILSV